MPLGDVYTTRDGSSVFPYPNAQEYWARDENLVVLFEGCIGGLDLTNVTDKKAFEVQMGRSIAPATLVTTLASHTNEELQFVRRGPRKGPSRVLLLPTNSIPDVSTLVVVVQPKFKWEDGKKVFLDEFMLVTCYPGVIAPNEPCNTKPDTNERQDSLEFWTTHALIYRPDMGEIFLSTWDDVLAEHDAPSKADANG
ncbi:hypothetical protein COV05_04175 [Candidatus Uhrbacteria bacterium CG10_big_fil_rev_8_21_14_0_10_48_16]|uniref:Uncharacterized protein n=1 Tax=Candidatus Uhrbacteria bacterium CG10_big_fil_rev_8_21_14_0_10_48_16 TaxID=1975038 RepID=A0A2M8LGG4_9BACT|nr:MAG: hypothetical protein COV05_04175 [Candidatus Uhrbacteria bacterium CG10_big_fil_rev_8_21_14_0_10_48_16]